jgi:chromate reductase
MAFSDLLTISPPACSLLYHSKPLWARPAATSCLQVSQSHTAIVVPAHGVFYSEAMKLLALSGSGRATSTNTALLKSVSEIAGSDHRVTVFAGLADLPVFSPDAEQDPLPLPVGSFIDLIQENDALIIASPEYIRAIPGGLKNAIDWLVSRDEIIGKPIALLHASHRGDDMLAQLRLVLATVSDGFTPETFARFDLMKLSPEQIHQTMSEPQNRSKVVDFLAQLTRQVAQIRA